MKAQNDPQSMTLRVNWKALICVFAAWRKRSSNANNKEGNKETNGRRSFARR
jgi:hypothetical protein